MRYVTPELAVCHALNGPGPQPLRLKCDGNRKGFLRAPRLPRLRFEKKRARLGRMPKRTSKQKLDEIQNARRVVDITIEESDVSPALVSQVMAQMGRKGGQIGGKRRLETMTPERRKEVASQAANIRWGAKKKAK